MRKAFRLSLATALALLQFSPFGYSYNYQYQYGNSSSNQSTSPTQTPEQSQQSYMQSTQVPSGGIYAGSSLSMTSQFMQNNSQRAMKERAKRIVDTNRNGRLSLEETAASLLNFHQTYLKARGNQGYNAAYDFDFNGRVDNRDRNVLWQLAIEHGTTSAIKAVTNIDRDRNGIISSQEASTTIAGFTASYEKYPGQRGFNFYYDYDGDRRVNSSDVPALNAVLPGQFSMPSSTTQVGPNTTTPTQTAPPAPTTPAPTNNSTPPVAGPAPTQTTPPASPPAPSPEPPTPAPPTPAQENNTTPPVAGPAPTQTTPPASPPAPSPEPPTPAPPTPAQESNTTPPVAGPAPTQTTPPASPPAPSPEPPTPAPPTPAQENNTTPPVAGPAPTQTTPPASPPAPSPEPPAPAPPAPAPAPANDALVIINITPAQTAENQGSSAPSSSSNANLTKEEKVMMQVDTNQDGNVSLREMAVAILNLQKIYRSSLGMPNYNAGFDFDGNNKITYRDRSALYDLARAEGMYHLTNVIRSVDRNRNNEISDSEATNAIKDFEAAYGKRRGERGYRYTLDYDRNRIIDSADADALAAVIGRDVTGSTTSPSQGATSTAAAPASPPPPAPTEQSNNSGPSLDQQIETQATSRAQTDLETHLNQFRTVSLWNFNLHTVSGKEKPGYKYYTAGIFGTNMTIWGVVNNSGTIVASGVSEAADEPTKIPQLLAQLWATEEMHNIFNELFAEIRNLNGKTVTGNTQFFMLKGILDIVKAKPAILSVISGYPTVLMTPFNVMRKKYLSNTQMNYLINGLNAEFDRNNTSHPELVAMGYLILTSILSSRGASLEEINQNPAPAYQQIKLIVDRIVESNPVRNPHFKTLLSVVENYHLPRVEVVLPNRRPEVLVTFMQRWLNVNKVTDNLEVSKKIALLAYELQSYSIPSTFKASAKAMYEKIINDLLSAAKRTSKLDALTAIMHIIVGNEHHKYGVDNKRFDFLSNAKQREIYDLIMRRKYRTNSIDEQDQNDYLVFLSYFYRDNKDLNFRDRNNIFRFVNSKLQSRVNDLLRIPVPSETDFASDYKSKLTAAIIIAKAIDQKKRLNPLLSKFTQRFQGSTSYPAETSAGYTKRLMLVRELWNKGLFIMDQANLFGRDIRLLEHTRDLYDRAGPIAYRVNNVIQSRYTEPRRARGSAGSNGVTILYRYVERENENFLDHSWRSGSLLTTVAHELGHLRDYVIDDKNRKRWTDLFGMSDRSSQDDYITNYAKTNSNEDFAETQEEWLIRNKSFFEKALDTGQSKNKWLLMEKYLYLTRISVEANGSNEFTQWSFHATNGPNGEEYVFEDQGHAVVGPIDHLGRISRIAIGDKSYQFIWSGERLTGVRVTPYRISYDVNRDGNVSALDATLIIQETSRIYNGATPNMIYDANEDGRVTSRDSMNVTSFYSRF